MAARQARGSEKDAARADRAAAGAPAANGRAPAGAGKGSGSRRSAGLGRGGDAARDPGPPSRHRPDATASGRRAAAATGDTGLLVRAGWVVALIGVLLLVSWLHHRPGRSALADTGQSAAPSKAGRSTSSSGERREYSGPPSAVSGTGSALNTPEAIAADARRDGPNGEPRIFENPQERSELVRGAPPKDLNGRFRYYFDGVSMTRPEDGSCKQPLLALLLVVQNLQAERVTAIRGKFTISKSAAAGDAATAAGADPGGISFRADIIGPFSNKHGGYVYAKAYAVPAEVFGDASGLERFLAGGTTKLKVWFAPEVLYFADDTQYTSTWGKAAAEREIQSCAGTEGAHKLFPR